MSPTQVLGNRFCKLMHMSWVLKYSKIAPWHSLLLLFSTDINSTEQLSKSHIRCGGREAGRRTQLFRLFLPVRDPVANNCQFFCGLQYSRRKSAHSGKHCVCAVYFSLLPYRPLEAPNCVVSACLG